MKVALVHRRFGLDGGTERFLESLARRLGQRGHDVTVYAAAVDPRFVRTRVASFQPLRAGARGGGWLLWLAALRVPRSRFDVVVDLGRTGPGAVYRAGGGSHRAWWQRLRTGAGGWRRLALALSPYHRLRLWHEGRALAGPTRVVVPSAVARAGFLEAWGRVAEKVEVIPNGVDLDRFHPKVRNLFFAEVRESLGLSPEELVLLFIGSDFHRKGLDVALRALASLQTPRSEVRLLVVGADRRREEYVAMADALGVRDRVTFLRAHERIEQVYGAVDALVLPTRFDPFANVTLEALGCGVPVVTSAANGAVEGLPHGESLAVIDDANDAEGFAAAIDRALAGDGLAERKAAARALAEQRAEADAVDRWERLLQEVAGGR